MYEKSQKQILLLAFSQELLKLCYILRIKFGNFWKMTPHEQRKRLSYFPLYWLFNRDPIKVAIPTCTQCVIPYILYPKQPGCFCFKSNPRKVLEKDDKPLPSGASQFPDPTELRSLNWVQTRKVEGNINKRDEDRDVESRIHSWWCFLLYLIFRSGFFFLLFQISRAKKHEDNLKYDM